MSIGYRSILSAEYSSRTLDELFGMLSDWVTEKKGFDRLPSDRQVLRNSVGNLLAGSEVNESNRGVSGYRWTLTEEWQAPAWYKNSETSRTGTTRISLVFSGHKLWFWVDIEPPELHYADSEGIERREVQNSGTPTFVSAILRRIEMNDGASRTVSGIRQINTIDELADLVDVLHDTTRFGSVYLSSPPEGERLGEWFERIQTILGRIDGMGTRYVLSPDMRLIFNNRVASGHGIAPGSIRTFLPGVDLLDSADAVRHRMLHASTIRESKDQRLNRIIRNRQIQRLRDIDLPEELRVADYAFLRKRSKQAIELLDTSLATVKKPESPPVEESTLRDQLVEIEELLNEVMNENAQLKSELDESIQDLVELRMESDIYEIDLSDLQKENERAHREIEFLRKELQSFGSEGAASAFGFIDEAEEEETPQTFSELIGRMESLPGIRYFGNRVDAENLDELSDLGEAALLKAWRALTTFSSYVSARNEGRYHESLRQYIDNTQHGFPMRITRVLWHEGKTVKSNNKMLVQRTIAVPKEVDPSGTKVLLSHIALATGRAGSPRLYFDDDYLNGGYVTIGYIGTHLDNTLTN